MTSSEGFADAFTVVFSTRELPAGQIEPVDAFLDAQFERLDPVPTEDRPGQGCRRV